jgi:hypothetical protein
VPLALNSNKTFSLDKTYANAGIYNVVVRVTDDDGAFATDTVVVNVTRQQVHRPHLDVTPGSAFGSTAVGTPVSRTFIVNNAGNAALTTSGLVVPAGFTVTDPLNASILAGGSDAFTIRFDAASAGTFGGNVSFSSNDPDAATFTIAISATATTPDPNPDLDPGPVPNPDPGPAPGPLPDAPDLVIEGGVTKLKAGNFVGGAKGGKARVRVFNRGTLKATGNLQVKFFASLDGTVDDSDTLLATVSKPGTRIKVGKSKKFSAKFNFPNGVPDGSYFILAEADAAGTFAETNESNNTALSAFAIGVAAPFVDLNGASLVAGKFELGKKGKATLGLHNSGNIKVAGTIAFQLFASTDDIFGNDDDVLIVSLSKKLSLKTGATKNVKLKSSHIALAAGAYHFFAAIDTAGAISESNEGNNIVSSVSAISIH